MIDKKPFHNILQKLKEEGKYRVFNDIVRERGEFPNAIWYGPYNIKNIINWCSNDYLGMGQNKIVIDAMHTALDQTGAGSGGTRNIGGTSHYHVALEYELAKLHRTESALLFLDIKLKGRAYETGRSHAQLPENSRLLFIMRNT